MKCAVDVQGFGQFETVGEGMQSTSKLSMFWGASFLVATLSGMSLATSHTLCFWLELKPCDGLLSDGGSIEPLSSLCSNDMNGFGLMGQQCLHHELGSVGLVPQGGLKGGHVSGELVRVLWAYSIQARCELQVSNLLATTQHTYFLNELLVGIRLYQSRSR